MITNKNQNLMNFPERAACYNFLSILLGGPLEERFIIELKNIAENIAVDTKLEESLFNLVKYSKDLDLMTLKSNYNNLFISVGEPILKPYSSYYLTGFLYEKPLAFLRSEMSRLGLGLNQNVSEPEDHISSIFEIMSILITSESFRKKVEEHKHFFQNFINEWVLLFFDNLAESAKDDFYGEVSIFGKIFINSEKYLYE